jgi:SPP1 family predicted phage head-tail adaptor
MATAGDLTERLTIEQDTPSTDTQGGRSASWATLATVWAQQIVASGAEVLQAEKLGSKVPVRFRIRERSDVTALMRVVWTPSWDSTQTAVTLQIRTVLPDTTQRRGVFRVLECTELT